MRRLTDFDAWLWRSFNFWRAWHLGCMSMVFLRPCDGQGQSSKDHHSLDHIEVLTIPFSSLYGNSSGGTILAETKKGQGKDSIQVGLKCRQPP